MGLLLPVHIVEVIFSKLPISNLPICRLVCKAWNDLIINSKTLISNGLLIVFTSDFDLNRTPNLVNTKMHCVDSDTLCSVASFKFNTDYLSGTILCHACNGLFFMSKLNPTRCVGILNPITNQFFKLPGFKYDDDDDGKIICFGFGFVPKTKKYKLFRIIMEGNNTSSCRMEVFRFSSEHDQWSLVSNTLPFGSYQVEGVYLNGFIYWIETNDNARRDEYVMNAFDVETEKFESTVVLKLGGHPKSMKIESFNDAIYAIVSINKPSDVIEVWRMREKDSWVRDFVFHMEEFDHWMVGLVHLVKAFEDGRMVVLIKDAYFCLDKMGRMVKIQTFDLNARHIMATCYLSSFNFSSLPHILTGHE